MGRPPIPQGAGTLEARRDTGEKKPARTMPLTGVAGTAEVAARGKLAAVRAGYYSDPYAECFVTGECTRPGPLINRGHHLRVAVIQSVVSQFLDAVGGARSHGEAIWYEFRTCIISYFVLQGSRVIPEGSPQNSRKTMIKLLINMGSLFIFFKNNYHLQTPRPNLWVPGDCVISSHAMCSVLLS